MFEVFPVLTVEMLTAPHKGAMKIGPFGSQLRKEEMLAHGVKVYGQENVISNDWTVGDRRISESKFRSLATCKLEAGDLVVSMMGTAGKCAVFPATAERGIMDSHLLRVQPNLNLVDRDYFAVSLQAENIVGRQVTAMSHGSIMAGLSSKIVKRFKIPLPPLDEQPQIVEILQTLDTAIQETDAIIAKLKAVKQGLLHDLLTRGIDANGELRPPHSEAPQLYKASPLGWIPREWSYSGLSDVSMKTRSVIRTGPFGSSLKGEHWRDSGRPVITIGSLGDGNFITSELLHIDEVTAKRLSDYELFSGDIVFSRVADVGRSVVINESEQGWIMSSNLMRISVDSNIVRPHYLQMLLARSLLVRKQIRTTVNSAGRDVANSAVLLGLSFPWPSLTEQDQTISQLTALEKRIDADEESFEKLRRTRAGLMDDLLTGRVRVTPLLDHA